MQLYFKHITLAILCFLPSLASPSQPLSYATIGNMVLQSEPALQKEAIISSHWQQESYEPVHTPGAQAGMPETPFLSVAECKKLSFLLLHTFSPEDGMNSPLLDAAAVDNLALVSKHQEASQCLLQQFGTKTFFGHAVTAKKLALPSPVLSEILRNQNSIKALTQSDSHYSEINHILETISLYEPFFLSLFTSNDAFHKKVFKELYYSNPENNKSIKMLALLRAYQTFWTETRFAIPRIALNTVRDELLTRAFRKMSQYKWLYDIEVTQSDRGKWMMRLTTIVAYGLQEMAFDVLFNRARVRADAEAINQMKAKLLIVVQLIEQCKKLQAAVLASPILSENLSRLVHQVTELLEGFHDSDCIEFLKILETGTFHNAPSYYLDSARVLAAYRMLIEHKEKFIPVLALVGELDALCAATQIYKNNHDSLATPYCFVTFVSGDTPIISLENFWHPLMTSQSIITNSINLGDSDVHNMIITGPNGSGKSVFMKSVALNLILAQSFGIAAASSAKLSVFDKFHIYLNIQENLELSLSTFMAEKKKMDEICKHVAQQPAGKKSFTLIDEGLKGTVEQSGGPHIYNAGRAMSNNPGNICLLATHFKKPTDLEQDTFGNFANYRLGLLEPHEGEFVRTFKLEKEKCDWWFENDAKRERFIAWLTTPALAL